MGRTRRHQKAVRMVAVVYMYSGRFDAHELHPPRGSALDRHGRPPTAEVPRDQGNELRVGLSINRRRLELGMPDARARFLENAGARVRLDLHLNDSDGAQW